MPAKQIGRSSKSQVKAVVPLILPMLGACAGGNVTITTEITHMHNVTEEEAIVEKPVVKRIINRMGKQQWQK